MTEDLLAQARQTQVQQARVRLGDYELREPDHRQICVWAGALAMTPENLLAELARSQLIPRVGEKIQPLNFALEDGVLRNLVWDFDRLPVFPDLWVKGLRLRSLGFTARSRSIHKTKLALAPRVPSLRHLILAFNWYVEPEDAFPLSNLNLDGTPQLISLECTYIPLMNLDLSPVQNLINLHWAGKVSEIDLSPTQGLSNLYYWGIGAAKLDLARVPGLTELTCGSSRLSTLDLSLTPKLTKLNCSRNELTALDLSPTPELTELACEENKLVEIDLTPIPRLAKLFCRDNELIALDLSPTPGLTVVECSMNKLTKLDLSPVPGLTELRCAGNRLTELDLSPVPRLTELVCEKVVTVRNAPPNLTIERW